MESENVKPPEEQEQVGDEAHLPCGTAHCGKVASFKGNPLGVVNGSKIAVRILGIAPKWHCANRTKFEDRAVGKVFIVEVNQLEALCQQCAEETEGEHERVLKRRTDYQEILAKRARGK